ncbi:RcpC/CpaB family pilus assembly protein [Actinocatenispora sera]|uniref:RcpC/CpaB family pilus assembly protein n=1 Tax=Actinocatenispora sera TaxID=390989 RepID=UPI0033D8588E
MRTARSRPRRRRAERLDPIRWSARRRSRLLRAAAVTALLVLAAGVLATGGGAAADEHRCTARAAPSPSRAARPGGRVPAGSVGVAVPVVGAGVGGLVHPGDRVDLTVAGGTDPTDGPGDPAEVLVRDALVLRGTTGHSADMAGESVVYLAMTEQQARRVAGVEPSARIGLTLRPG